MRHLSRRTGVETVPAAAARRCSRHHAPKRSPLAAIEKTCVVVETMIFTCRFVRNGAVAGRRSARPAPHNYVRTRQELAPRRANKKYRCHHVKMVLSQDRPSERASHGFPWSGRSGGRLWWWASNPGGLWLPLPSGLFKKGCLRGRHCCALEETALESATLLARSGRVRRVSRLRQSGSW